MSWQCEWGAGACDHEAARILVVQRRTGLDGVSLCEDHARELVARTPTSWPDVELEADKRDARTEWRALARLEGEEMAEPETEHRLDAAAVAELRAAGKTPTQIARELNCPRSSVSSLLARAARKNGHANGNSHATRGDLESVRERLDARWNALSLDQKLDLMLPPL